MQVLHHALSHIEELVLTTNITHTETFNSYTHVQWWYTTHAVHVYTSAYATENLPPSVPRFSDILLCLM